MSDTPRTDSQETFCDGNGDERVRVLRDFARQLERENIALRTALKPFSTVGSLWVCHGDWDSRHAVNEALSLSAELCRESSSRQQ